MELIKFWCFCILACVFMSNINAEHIYLNQFGVHIEGGHEAARRVARETGMKNLGQIGSLADHYLFEAPQREKRSSSISHDHHAMLNAHEKVKWFEQQKTLIRKKRDFHPRDVAQKMTIVDPLWRDEWYLNGGGAKGYDMNVFDAWRDGYTGKNIVVTILDDGLERNHPDLIRNYDPSASYDVNNHDNDPMPRYDPSNENRHGTRCAGEVAAEGNNTKCIIGIAPDSRIGGVRMLDGEVSDAVEAASLSFNRSHIDIYSASWGPDDDGKVVEGPGRLARKAFIDGIGMGRNKKGSIFVWASGNGGNAEDSCNCDGYANSVFTLSISSTSENGRKPWYLEECSSTLATTYSSGSGVERKIATTDLKGGCTAFHTGTSASAPLAAGIVALMLDANNGLTWRDVQYITLMTSRPEPMVDGNWVTNGVGRKVSLRYGYGLMDASAMVKLALRWTNVPPKEECLVVSPVHNQMIHGQQKFVTELETNGCKGLKTEVNHLEHVQAKISLTYSRRGSVVIYLTSPSGTRSKLLPFRPRDILQGGFDGWPFLSVHFWGEDPSGKWILEIEDGDGRNQHMGSGTFLTWSLVLHGTKNAPVKLKSEPVTSTMAVGEPEVVETPKVWLNNGTFTNNVHQEGTTVKVNVIPPHSTMAPQKCHEECLSGCHGPKAKDCIECKHLRMESSLECVRTCPDGYFALDSVCHSCDESCATCNGPTLIQCLSCKINMHLDEKHHICSAECASGYYLSKMKNDSPNIPFQSVFNHFVSLSYNHPVNPDACRKELICNLLCGKDFMCNLQYTCLPFFLEPMSKELYDFEITKEVNRGDVSMSMPFTSDLDNFDFDLVFFDDNPLFLKRIKQD